MEKDPSRRGAGGNHSARKSRRIGGRHAKDQAGKDRPGESLRYGSGRDADARGGGGHHLPPLHRAVTRGLFGGAPLPVDFGLLCH